MIENRKTRQLLRTSLLVLNLVLIVVLILSIGIGLYSLRSQVIAHSMIKNQYFVFDLDHIEQKEEEIKPDRSVAITPTTVSQEKTNDNNSNQSPKIAILLTGLGLDKKATQMSLTLPPTVSLGFLPYTTSMKSLMHDAMQRGHEIFLYAPFQLDNADNNPGMLPILLSNSSEQNISNLERLTSGFINCTGIYSVHNEIFSQNGESVTPVVEFIKNKKMLLLLGNNKNIDILLNKYDNIIAHPIVVDTKLDKLTIKQNLKELVALAKVQGKVLGTLQGYPITINLLNEWIPSLIEQGVELVPVSSLRGK